MIHDNWPMYLHFIVFFNAIMWHLLCFKVILMLKTIKLWINDYFIYYFYTWSLVGCCYFVENLLKDPFGEESRAMSPNTEEKKRYLDLVTWHKLINSIWGWLKETLGRRILRPLTSLKRTTFGGYLIESREKGQELLALASPIWEPLKQTLTKGLTCENFNYYKKEPLTHNGFWNCDFWGTKGRECCVIVSMLKASPWIILR